MVGGLLLLVAGYVLLARGRPELGVSRPLLAAAGLAVLWLALETPLDSLGDRYSQSAHMVQHVLLGVVAPPLLLLGLDRGMAAAVATAMGPARRLLGPVPAQLISAAVMLMWHLPPAYNLTLENDGVHILEHLTFIAAGVIFWWPVLEATSASLPKQMGIGARFVYLLIGTVPQDTVALVLQFSREVFYPHYANAYPLLAGWTPVIDQNVAGVVLMVFGKTSFAIAAVALFYRWAAADRYRPGEEAIA